MAAVSRVFRRAMSIMKQPPRLTHVGEDGRARMVDVSDKPESAMRRAVASAQVKLGKATYELLEQNQLKKGDALAVAQLAGVMGAKRTADLIPLCHPIALTNVQLELTLNAAAHSVMISATASARGPTGVEMEALTAVSVAGLTLYDMCKASSKEIEISDIRLEAKSGGRSGDYERTPP